MKENRFTSREKIIIAAAALLLVLLVAAGFLYAKVQGWSPLGGFYDVTGTTIETAENATGLEDLNEKVKEGMMNVTISPKVSVSGTAATIRFENREINTGDQKVTITLDDTGEVLYESGAIAPGKTIETAELNRRLQKGVHAATAQFTGFAPKTHTEAGHAAIALELVVGGEGEVGHE